MAQGVRPVGVQGLGEQGGVPGDTSGAWAVHDAAGQGLQGLPPLREGRGDPGLVHGGQLGGRRVLRVREAHHEVVHQATSLPLAGSIFLVLADERKPRSAPSVTWTAS